MSWYRGFEDILTHGAPLSGRTTFGIGGAADALLEPRGERQFAEAWGAARASGLPVHLLGGGSNLLIADAGVRGVVVTTTRLRTEPVRHGDRVTTPAGLELRKLLRFAMKCGLSGLEPLVGVPGTVGGAVRMNAGGSYGDIGSCVQSVTLMDKDGNVFEKEKPELVFDYRWANITAPVILKATMELTEADPNAILKTVKEIWITKKNSQPLNTRNAGCVFKNPRGMSAGALIDRAGLKGAQIGGATVSEKHANFIVTEKGCTASDVKQLIELIRQRVKEAFDVELELEIEIW